MPFGRTTGEHGTFRVIMLSLAACATVQAQSPIAFNYVYDEIGQLVKVVDSTGIVIEYVYDEVGNMLEIKRSTLPNPGALSIFGFTPQLAGPLSVITIQGQGFGSTPALNNVTVGGVPARVLTASATALTLEVPISAVTGPIVVTVGGVSATSSGELVVPQAPIVMSVSPRAATGGSTVNLTISGINMAGASFVLEPQTVPPAALATPVSFSQDGTGAVVSLKVSEGAKGTFAVVARTVAGSSSAFLSPANRFVIPSSDPNADTDMDGLDDALEISLGTDPTNPDTDADGWPDGLEVELGSDPLDPSSTPDVSVPVQPAFTWSLLNRALPTLTEPVPVQPAFTWSLLNRALPTLTEPVAVQPAFTWSLLNRALPTLTEPVAVQPAFTWSLLNRALPTLTEPVAVQPAFTWSLLIGRYRR